MSRRTDIRKAVVSLLKATFPGNVVYDSRAEIIPDDQTPVMVVWGTDETTDPDAGHMGIPIYRRALIVRVEFNGGGTDGQAVTDTLEDMLDTAETALYADAGLEAITFNFWLASVDVAYSADSGDTRMQLGANFTAEYERAH